MCIRDSSITVHTSGNYFVTTTNSCGTATSNHIIVNINPAPTASVILANGPITFCIGDSVTLSGNVGGTWNTTALTNSITVFTSGNYFVTTTNSCGVITSNHIIVNVNPAPTASVILANGPITFCTGDSLILSGNVGGTWNTTALTDSITVHTSGNYFVTTTNTCGVVTSNHIIVTVNSIPVANATSNSPVCTGSAINLFATTVSGATYNWTGPNAFVSGSQNPVNAISVLADGGVYTLTILANGCSSLPSTVTVVVSNCGFVDLSIVKTVDNAHPVIGQTILFTLTASNIGSLSATGVTVTEVLQSGYSYVSSSSSIGSYSSSTGIWTIGSLANGAIETLTITAIVIKNGVYTNTATISGNESEINTANNTSTIETFPSDFFIPAGFSPNGDAINDVFFIRGIENYTSNKFVVFNRWGNKVYETSNYQNTWDGKSTLGLKVGGDELPTGTYFYILNLGDGTDVFKGTITLNR